MGFNIDDPKKEGEDCKSKLDCEGNLKCEKPPQCNGSANQQCQKICTKPN